MQVHFYKNVLKKITENEPNRLKTLTGKGWYALLVDTSIIHRGVSVKKWNQI